MRFAFCSLSSRLVRFKRLNGYASFILFSLNLSLKVFGPGAEDVGVISVRTELRAFSSAPQECKQEIAAGAEV